MPKQLTTTALVACGSVNSPGILPLPLLNCYPLLLATATNRCDMERHLQALRARPVQFLNPGCLGREVNRMWMCVHACLCLCFRTEYTHTLHRQYLPSVHSWAIDLYVIHDSNVKSRVCYVLSMGQPKLTRGLRMCILFAN